MKYLLISLLFIFSSSNPVWFNNLNDAKKNAKEDNTRILLVFSGSDWCKPCIQLKGTVFESDEFKNITSNYKLVNIDFKKDDSSFSKEEIKHNEAVAEKYNPNGFFPLVLILDHQGNVMKSIDGYKGETASYYIETYLK